MSSLFEYIRSQSSYNEDAIHLIREGAEGFLNETYFTEFSSIADAWDFICKHAAHVPNLNEEPFTYQVQAIIEEGKSIFSLVEDIAVSTEIEIARITLENDLDILEEALDLVDMECFKVWRIENELSSGWLAHTSEKDFSTKRGGAFTLYHWRNVEGTGPQWEMSVKLSDGTLYLRLTKEEV